MNPLFMAAASACIVALVGCSTKPESQPREETARASTNVSAVPIPIASVDSAADPPGLVEDDYVERARQVVTTENLEAELDALEAEIGEPD